MSTDSVKWVCGALAMVLGAGCATDYVGRTKGVRAAYRSYQEDKALTLLGTEKSNPTAIDALLVLLDQGTILHAQGKWKESIEVLAHADELAQQVDTISVTEEVGTVLANEGTRMYRGEDFEKLMISVLQALNYAQLGDDEGALVEVRRCNERLEKMVAKEKKNYQQLPIAPYLGGLFYENEREFDSAAIDYLRAVELAPDSQVLAAAALRLAKQTARDDAYRQLKARYPTLDDAPTPAGHGQVVVLLELGLVPEKHSSKREGLGGQLIAVPRYPPKVTALPAQRVTIDGVELQTQQVTSVNQVAYRFLEERIGGLIAKSAVSLGLKAGAGALVGGLTRSKELGALTFILLSATQQADTRSWLSLPAEFHAVRTTHAPGPITITVNALGKSTTHEVQVIAGKTAIVVVRRY